MPKTPDYFAGKTIVITGAGSGIGRATALIFAREGANVVCADINEAGVTETVEQVNAKFGNSGGQALALTIDVTKRAAVEDMVQLAIDGFGMVSSRNGRQCGRGRRLAHSLPAVRHSAHARRHISSRINSRAAGQVQIEEYCP